MSARDELIAALNELIAALTDTIEEFEAAAEHARSYMDYAEYERDIDVRRRAVRWLSGLVRRIGGYPTRQGSFWGGMKRAMSHLLGGTLHNDRLVARVLEHEERQVDAALHLLARERRLPPDIQKQFQTLLHALGTRRHRQTLHPERERGASSTR